MSMLSLPAGTEQQESQPFVAPQAKASVPLQPFSLAVTAAAAPVARRLSNVMDQSDPGTFVAMTAGVVQS